MDERSQLVIKKPNAKRGNSVSKSRKPGYSQSMSSPIDRIFVLQRTIGNQAVQRLIKSGALQTKLRVSKSGDKYEQEADLIADTVLQMPKPKAVDLDSHIQALSGSGKPLPESVHSFFESRFGFDFGHVRLHTDSLAAKSARSLGAQAYTFGSEVVFGNRQYSPNTTEGQRLLAHELTHVVQQKQGRVSPTARIAGIPVNDNPQLETEADRVYKDFSLGYSKTGIKAPSAHLVGSRTLTNVVVQRNPDGVPSTREEREAVRRMEQDITIAEQLLRQDLSEDERERIRRAIMNARERLENYQELRDRGETRTATMAGIGVAAGAILADDATGIGVADDPLLILLGLAAIATLIATRPPAGNDAVAEAWRQTGQAIGELASAIETIVWMTAAGNVIHEHIVEEARQLAIALGLAASAAAVTREMLCEMLRRMATQYRRTDTKKWKKINSTMKGLSCRRSRAGR